MKKLLITLYVLCCCIFSSYSMKKTKKINNPKTYINYAFGFSCEEKQRYLRQYILENQHEQQDNKREYLYQTHLHFAQQKDLHSQHFLKQLCALSIKSNSLTQE